jgi:hypothetical protein
MPPRTINGRDSIACVVFVFSVIGFTHAFSPGLPLNAEKYRAMNIFNRCREPEAPEIKPDEADRCNIVEIRIAEMTVREKRDSRGKYWKFSFARTIFSRVPALAPEFFLVHNAWIFFQENP